MADGREPVDAGVAGGAKGNQPFQSVLTGAAVMHMNPPWICMRGAAALARTPVPEKNRLAMTAETALRIPEAHLAQPAEIGASSLDGATGAEEAALGRHGVIIVLILHKAYSHKSRTHGINAKADPSVQAECGHSSSRPQPPAFSWWA